MQNLLLLLTRYSSILLFVLLELVCVYLIVNFNQRQRSIFLNSSSAISASVLNRYNTFTSYVDLNRINDSLQLENANLLKEILNTPSLLHGPDTVMVDTAQRYEIIPAEIINMSISSRNNSITIDKGFSDGIEEGMGVISKDGIVGIVQNSSKNYAQLISLLNTQMKVSAKLEKSGIIGELSWEGRDPRFAVMEAIPKHALITIGDSIVTSGFSTIFPKDYLVGFVEEINLERNGFYSLEIRLNNDFYSLSRVYVVRQLFKNEIDSLNMMN